MIATGIEAGLLINFGERAQIKRKVKILFRVIRGTRAKKSP